MLALVLMLGFTGCMNRNNNQNDEPEPGITEEDELVIYHNSTGLAPMLMALAEEYSAATGKKVSTKLSGNDFMGEMQSNTAAIYVIDTHSDLSGWHSEGMFSDFLNDTGLSSVVSKIPAGLQFNQNGIGSYGIPLLLEGYGYIFDREMISALFGAENTDNIINDLRTCSFTEFEGFVAAVDTYISAPSATTVKIGANEYTFAAEKTGKAQNLTGVFSLNSESTRAMEHLFSHVLAAKFASRYEVMTAAEESVLGMEDALNAYVEVLDLHTSHIAGAEGSINRGDEFIGGDYNYSTSVDLFTRGNALFYPGGTSDTADFEKSYAGFSENLDIIPMKLPLSDEEITAAGMTAEKLQSSIVIGSRYYIAINPSADAADTAAARDFVRWIFNEEAGKAAYSGAFGTVPFNFEYILSGENQNEPSAETENFGDETENGTVSPENTEPSMPTDENASLPANENSSAGENSIPEQNPDMVGPINPSHIIQNSLMAAVAEYYAAGNWIPDMSFTLPADFADKIFGEGLSDYWGMETWAESDRKNFVSTIIEGWRERIDKENSAVG